MSSNSSSPQHVTRLEWEDNKCPEPYFNPSLHLGSDYNTVLPSPAFAFGTILQFDTIPQAVEIIPASPPRSAMLPVTAKTPMAPMKPERDSSFARFNNTKSVFQNLGLKRETEAIVEEENAITFTDRGFKNNILALSPTTRKRKEGRARSRQVMSARKQRTGLEDPTCKGKVFKYQDTLAHKPFTPLCLVESNSLTGQLRSQEKESPQSNNKLLSLIYSGEGVYLQRRSRRST